LSNIASLPLHNSGYSFARPGRIASRKLTRSGFAKAPPQCLRHYPLRSLNRSLREPPEPCGSAVFKTAAMGVSFHGGTSMRRPVLSHFFGLRAEAIHRIGEARTQKRAKIQTSRRREPWKDTPRHSATSPWGNRSAYESPFPLSNIASRPLRDSGCAFVWEREGLGVQQGVLF